MVGERAASMLILLSALAAGCGRLRYAASDASLDAPAPSEAGFVPSEGGPMSDVTTPRVDSPTGEDDAGESDEGGTLVDASGTTTCVDDAREDNDDFATVMASLAVTGVSPVTLSLVSCPGDADYIRAHSDCCSGQQGAVLTWSPADGEIDMEILGPTGAVLSITPVRAPGSIELLRGNRGGDFYVRIVPVSGTSVPYTVTIYAPTVV